MIKAHGEITQSGLILEGRAELHGMNFNTDGVNDLTVVVYDGTLPQGKILWRQTIKGPDVTGGVLFTAQGMLVENGIYVAMTTGGAGAVNAYYRM